MATVWRLPVGAAGTTLVVHHCLVVSRSVLDVGFTPLLQQKVGRKFIFSCEERVDANPFSSSWACGCFFYTFSSVFLKVPLPSPPQISENPLCICFCSNAHVYQSGCQFAQKQSATSQKGSDTSLRFTTTLQSRCWLQPQKTPFSQSHSEACGLTRILKTSANQVQTSRVEAFFCFG